MHQRVEFMPNHQPDGTDAIAVTLGSTTNIWPAAVWRSIAADIFMADKQCQFCAYWSECDNDNPNGLCSGFARTAQPSHKQAEE